MTPLDLEAIDRKARPIAEWDEERDAPDQECVACKGTMHTLTELEPTALCSGCAQTYAAATAPVVLALIAYTRELEAAVRACVYGGVIPSPHSVEGENRLIGLLDRGAVLP